MVTLDPDDVWAHPFRRGLARGAGDVAEVGESCPELMSTTAKAQAQAMLAPMPSADCRCGNSFAPADSQHTLHDFVERKRPA